MSYQQQDENIIDGFESSEEDEDGSSLHFGDDFYGDEITDQSGQTTSDMYNSHQYNQQSIMQSQDEEEDDYGIMFNVSMLNQRKQNLTAPPLLQKQKK